MLKRFLNLNKRLTATWKGVEIESAGANILGDLSVPEDAKCAVIFAHGSGSGRFSVRNKLVAQYLNKAAIATLLIDLLTKEEDAKDALSAQFRFDINLLAERLISATHWLKENPATKKFNIGYFGASTGAAASLVAAANLPDIVRAVVSRGGRPDLADAALPAVEAATLLIVGGNDPVVIAMNESAMKKITAKKELVVISGAGHLFEEAGKLDEVAALAKGWFLQNLRNK